MFAWIMGALMALVFISGITGMTSEPAPVTAQHGPEMPEAADWAMYWHEAYEEYEDEFTRIYNGYETRWSKNGRLMIRNGDSGPYKFVKRSK